MDFEFYKLWEKLDFTCYGSGEDVLIEDLRKIGEYLIRNKEEMKKTGWTGNSFLYDYEEIGKVVGHQMYGWCIINMLANAKFIDWGTSIRYGWVDTEGERFFDYILKYPTNVLYEAIDGEEDINEIIVKMKDKGNE